MVLKSIWPMILCLFGASTLMAVKTATSRLSLSQLESLLENWPKELYFFKLIQKLFKKERLFPITDFLSLSAIISLTSYAIAAAIYLISNNFLKQAISQKGTAISIAFYWFIVSALILAAIAILIYAVFHLFASKYPLATLRILTWVATPYLFCLFPFTYPLIWLGKALTPISAHREPKHSSEKLKLRLMEILNDEDFTKRIDQKDLRQLRSLTHFGDLSTREVMIPRIAIESLPNNCTIMHALEVFIKEGYSRLPVYKENIDYMVGMLLFKDVVEYCYSALDFNMEKAKQEPISKLITPILYAPENKRIRDLFQEMRVNKIHIGIIVNEYGVTEGLVTIEDILEELVGNEILDEHDDDEECSLYSRSSEQEWFVDAKMSILDAEKELCISLPHNAEYETIGGFISSVFGSIPPPGTIIHNEDCTLQVLESDKRQILKVKITKAQTK